MPNLVSAADLPDVTPTPTEAKAPAPKAVESKPEPKAEPKQEAKAPEPTAEQKAEVRRLKIKYAGREEEVTEEEVIRLAQMGKDAQTKWSEAAQMRKQNEALIAMLKDPKELRRALQDPRIGVDLKAFAEDYLYEQLQEEALTPEQKKTREIERELERYRESERKTKEEQEKAQFHQLQAKYEADFEQRIQSALTGGGLPVTKGTVQRMGYYLQQAMQNGFDLTPQDLVAKVRQDYIEEHRALYEPLDGDQLEQFLGTNVGKKLRESDLKKLKNTHSQSFSSPRSKPGKGDSSKQKKMTGQDWKEQARKEFLGK